MQDDGSQFRLRSRHQTGPTSEIMSYLERAGFVDVAKISYLKVDLKLVVALLERWRPETHTFHLPIGECTITLEGVGMLLGLRINGKAVNGPTWIGSKVYIEYLGIEPPMECKIGNFVKMVWLDAVLEELKNKSSPTEEINILHAKIYILLLIARVLMPDKSHNLLHTSRISLVGDLDKCNRYSWGSACLATLYKHMCKPSQKGVKSIGGCVVLFSVRALTCIPLLTPESNVMPSHP